eukprot:365173-Chlamydomonas_euryale.AAC.10
MPATPLPHAHPWPDDTARASTRNFRKLILPRVLAPFNTPQAPACNSRKPSCPCRPVRRRRPPAASPRFGSSSPPPTAPPRCRGRPT